MDNNKWAEFYRSSHSNVKHVFIKVMTTDGEHFFFHDYDQWFEVKKYCEKNSVFIQDLHLQFRSNRCIIDVSKADAIYLIRAVLGAMGQSTKQYLTVGILADGKVTKKMYVVPELIKEKEHEDTLENCFDEAVIYNEKTQKNRKEQVQA
jgi:hypothetical protein